MKEIVKSHRCYWFSAKQKDFQERMRAMGRVMPETESLPDGRQFTQVTEGSEKPLGKWDDFVLVEKQEVRRGTRIRRCDLNS